MESAQNDDGRSNQLGSDGNSPNDKSLERERQGLLLSRAYLLHRIESSTNDRYTESLRQALAEIDRKLAQFKPR